MKISHPVLMFAMITTCALASGYNEMSYRDFVDHLRDGAVSAVTFHTDSMMVDLGDEAKTTTFFVRGARNRYDSDPLLWDELKSAGVTPTTQKAANPPLGILFIALLPSFLWHAIAVAMLGTIILLHRKMNRIISLLSKSHAAANTSESHA